MTRISFPAAAWFAIATTSLATVAAFPAARADADWPSFRGSADTGRVVAGELPARLDASTTLWQHELKSRDVGSPIVWKDRLFLLRSRPARSSISLDCLSLTDGTEIWSAEFPQSDYHLHQRNTLASGTPAADAEQVYVTWSDGAHTFLVAMDHEGQEIWRRDFGRFQSQHGYGASPLVVGEQVILFFSQQAESLDPGDEPGESRMIAVDRKTGNTHWTCPLTTTRVCYGTPAVVDDASGRPKWLIGANTGDGLFGIDLTNGRLQFRSDAFSKRCCSSPLVVGDLLIGSCGSGGGGNEMVAVRMPDQGSIAREVYRIKSGAPYVPTAVVRDGKLFAVDDRGIASCFDAMTGETITRKRLGGNFGASPILVGDKILAIDLQGKATVMSADDKMESLLDVDLGGPVGATPVFVQGKLIIRVDDRLVCYAGESS